MEKNKVLNIIKKQGHFRYDLDPTFLVSDVILRYHNIIDRNFAIELLDEAYMSKIIEAEEMFLNMYELYGKKGNCTKKNLIDLAVKCIKSKLKNNNIRLQNGNVQTSFPCELLYDDEVIKKALRVDPSLLTGNGLTLEFGVALRNALTVDVINDITTLRGILAIYPKYIVYCGKNVKKDIDLALLCIVEDISTIRYFDIEIQKNPYVVAIIVKILNEKIENSIIKEYDAINLLNKNNLSHIATVLKYFRHPKPGVICEKIKIYIDLVSEMENKNLDENDEIEFNDLEELTNFYERFVEVYLGLEEGSIGRYKMDLCRIQSEETLDNQYKKVKSEII